MLHLLATVDIMQTTNMVSLRGWLDIVGVIFAFVGSVIFSAGLLKGKGQIEAENATYFDGNPYTLSSALGARKNMFTAFVFIMVGFAITISSGVSRMCDLDASTTTLVLGAIALIGVLTIGIIYLYNNKAHIRTGRKTKNWQLRYIINKSASKYVDMIGKENESELFTQSKKADIERIEKIAAELGDKIDSSIPPVVAGIRSAKTAAEFTKAVLELKGKKLF